MSFVSRFFAESWISFVIFIAICVAIAGVIAKMSKNSVVVEIFESSKFWVTAHFFFWMALGTFKEMTWKKAIPIMVIWELFEFMWSKYEDAIPFIPDSTTYFNESSDKRFMDFIANISGFMLTKEILK
jgi:hypothetical protein